MHSSVQLGGVGERVVSRDRQTDRQRQNSNCLLCIGHRPLYKLVGKGLGKGRRGVGVGGHIVKQAKQRNKGGGGEKGGAAVTHTQKYPFLYICYVTYCYSYYQKIDTFRQRLISCFSCCF